MKKVIMTRLSLVAILGCLTFAVQNGMAQKPQMELLDLKPTTGASSVSFVGQVKNISALSVRGITAYIDLMGAGGKVIRTGEGHLKTDPLPAGATTEFKVEVASSSDVKGFNVRFGRMFGGPLKMLDSRKAK